MRLLLSHTVRSIVAEDAALSRRASKSQPRWRIGVRECMQQD